MPGGAPARQGRRRIRVMVVDDSIVARAVLVRLLQTEPDIAVVAEAGSGHAALAALAIHEVDVVLLDIEMPGMSGLEALPVLLDRGGDARVMVVSSACREGASSSIQALRLGAADTLLKPDAGGLAGAFSRALLERVRRLGTEPAVQPPPAPTAIAAITPPNAPEAAGRDGGIDCIAIGASTGGVHALAAFFAALPASVESPILVTQHLPAPFMPYFVGQLVEMSGRKTQLAADGMPILPGTILLAPGDAHLGLARTRGLAHVRLERRPMPSGCTPSVDPMLSGVARVFGAGGLAVILSGMGRDGEIGAADLAAAGGEVFAQDAASSVVWGMPGAVAGKGLATRIAPPAILATEVQRRAATGKAAAWT